MNRVTASIWMIQTWIPMVCPDPREDVDELRRQDRVYRQAQEEVVRQFETIGGGEVHRQIAEIRQRFGQARPAHTAAEATRDEGTGRSASGWKWYDARYMISTALGAPRPEWDGVTFSWWMDRERGNPIDAAARPEEIAALPIPDWANLPMVKEMQASRRRWQEAFPGDHPEYANVSLLSARPGEQKQYVAYPSFVDLGIFLLGTTDFLTELGMETDLAEALMAKSLELSTSYVDFVHTLDPRQMELLLGFAGDTACLLSPELYEKYSVRWDAGLFEHLRAHTGCAEDFPCNLHSCGPSTHLYDAWGSHPHNDHIVVLQTRLVPGTVERLRRNMRNTYLQLTFHPQHFDIARESPEEFRRVLMESADHAQRRDVHFSIIAVVNKPGDVPGLQANLEVMAKTLDELNSGG